MVEQNYNRTESQKTENEKSFLKKDALACLSERDDHREDRNELNLKELQLPQEKL